MSAEGVCNLSTTPFKGDCDGCPAIKNIRTFCEKCRNGRPYTWRFGRRWRTKEGPSGPLPQPADIVGERGGNVNFAQTVRRLNVQVWP